ncbi:amidohydrolase family protein [Paenibacillus eucommiae]|uniref:TIM-barrel fold metal-dependent hydrolase n=1 Tax=Paenibacillus eucommiae TaxID=1355755 RepID=A0ABS4IM36_9BACL|nr:amidohydrolase family protein [Paenibacillus eucommiae]MBP1988627.1 putative TIM-barrel fold metal-dependent hydrolase [Paenibacillus eucommiae]
MIIDSHNHPFYGHMNVEKTLQNMEKCHIDRTWMLTLETPADETWPGYYSSSSGNEFAAMPFANCLHYVEKAPEKFVLGYAPDPRRPYALSRLEAAIEMYGVRICGEIMLRMTYDNPDAISMFRFCGKRGLPVIVEVNYGIDAVGSHAQPGYWYGGGIEAFERMVRQCPDTIFLGHGPGFWSHISGDDLYQKHSYPSGDVLPGGKVTEMMRTYDNLYCDLSARSGYNALTRTPAFGKEFLLEFQDRVLYGRDDWDNRLQEFLNGSGLSQEVIHKIYAGNSLKLVPL